MPAATIKINFPGKRIKEAKVLDDGSCELFVETEVKDSESKEKEILIPDSWLSVPKNSEFI